MDTTNCVYGENHFIMITWQKKKKSIVKDHIPKMGQEKKLLKLGSSVRTSACACVGMRIRVLHKQKYSSWKWHEFTETAM